MATNMVGTTSTNDDTPMISLQSHESSTRIDMASRSQCPPIRCLSPTASDGYKNFSSGSKANSNHDQMLSFIQTCRSTIGQTNSCTTRTTTTEVEPFSDKDNTPRSNTNEFNRNTSQHKKRQHMRKNPKLKVIVKNKVMTPFPILVFYFVSSGDPNYVQWTNHGSQFTLFTHNGNKLSSLLCKHMLPKLSSFIRKLYFYGWKQLPNPGKFQRTFYHPSFHKCATLCNIATHITNQSTGIQSGGGQSLSTTLPSYKNNKARDNPIVSPSPRPMRTCTKKPPTSKSPRGSVVIGGAHNDLETTKVTMSPISIAYAPSRCYDVLFSPLNTLFPLFHEDDRDHDYDHDHLQIENEENDELLYLVCDERFPSSGIDSIRVSTNSPFWPEQKQSTIVKVSNDSRNDIDNDDDVSELSVPMTPLSMNDEKLYGQFGRSIGNENNDDW